MRELVSTGRFNPVYSIWVVMPERRFGSELWTWEREYCLMRAAVVVWNPEVDHRSTVFNLAHKETESGG